MKKLTIGQVYMNSDYFQDEANQTMGKPGTSLEVFKNRRRVTSKLTPKGKELLATTKAFIERKYNVEVKLSWSKYAGCKMCPCSPGFLVKAQVPDSVVTAKSFKQKERFDIFFDEVDDIDFRTPIYEYDLKGLSRDMVTYNKEHKG